ncbi:cytochrome P450 [Euzebya sp.]|uniref:cytochrome P450 n=1 Tax=Euzebya sp. TaxID=1971409 RepID=UPI003510DB91
MSATALDDVDLLSPEATEDPYSVFATLRDTAPAVWSERHQSWVVARFSDVEAALTHRGLSSDRVAPVLARQRAKDEPGTESSATRVLDILKSWMVVSDPPEHTRLRKLAAGAFKAQRISLMGEHIQSRVDAILDDFISSGERDLIHHVAYPLPAAIIAEMMGVPLEDQDRFRAWSDELALVAFGAGGEARGERHTRALRGIEEMFAYLQGLVDAARAAPGEDMISALAAPVEDGDRLADDELLSMLALLLFAGHETTINATANGVLALLRNPDQLALLREQPDLAPKAVEEVLRIDGAIKVLIRWTTEDVEVGDMTIPAGDRVFLALAGANHDPDYFPDASAMDITRHPNRHVAFGRGIHACIGAQLARLEMRHMIASVVERLPGLRLADDAEISHVPSLAARALRELPVVHDA